MLPNQLTLVGNIEEMICNIYKTDKLTNIAGMDQKYLIKGKNIYAWQGKLLEKSRRLNPEFDFLKCFDECLFCSDEVMYFTVPNPRNLTGKSGFI
jgi:hypothetical protein